MKVIADHLGKRFNREWVFRNFSYEFEPGNFYVITGPNGSGKSTLMQVLWGQMQPSAGNLTYTGIEPSKIFQSVAIAAPYMELIDEFTLEEMVRFHFKFKKTNLSQEIIMEKIGLPSAQKKHISSFSSGMRQRLKLALAFYSEAEVLFLDEPCTNLDKNSMGWYHEQLVNVPKESITIIASNQELEYPQTPFKKIDILSFK